MNGYRSDRKETKATKLYDFVNMKVLPPLIMLYVIGHGLWVWLAHDRMIIGVGGILMAFAVYAVLRWAADNPFASGSFPPKVDIRKRCPTAPDM